MSPFSWIQITVLGELDCFYHLFLQKSFSQCWYHATAQHALETARSSCTVLLADSLTIGKYMGNSLTDLSLMSLIISMGKRPPQPIQEHLPTPPTMLPLPLTQSQTIWWRILIWVWHLSIWIMMTQRVVMVQLDESWDPWTQTQGGNQRWWCIGSLPK